MDQMKLGEINSFKNLLKPFLLQERQFDPQT